MMFQVVGTAYATLEQHAMGEMGKYSDSVNPAREEEHGRKRCS